MSFAPVRLDGGGCCNVHALNAAGTVMAAGSDTQGYYLTATSPLGNKWTVQNKGIGASSFYRQCAALLWSSSETNVLYSLAGNQGSGGGLLAGTYSPGAGSVTWALRSGVPQGSGNTRGATPAALPSNGWQRSTGRLLYQDASYLFAATYQQGILRSSNTGGTGVAGSDGFPVACTMAGAAPGTGSWFATAIAPDPNVSTTLYAAFYDASGNAAGLWQTTTAHGAAPNFTQIAGGPAGGIEDIFLTGQYLYCTAGSSGIWRYGPLNGTPAWAGLNGGSVDTASTNWWNTVTGYVDGSSNHVVIIGDSNPATMSKTLMQLTIPSNYPTGSITYANLTGSVQVTSVPTAAGSYSWWIPASGLHVYLGGGGFINPQVNVDASNLGAVKLYCAGSGGAYRNIAGAGWTVANSGMPMFLAHPVAANPVHAGHLVWGDSDWCMFDDTAPGAETAATLANDPPVSSTEGFAVAISADGLTVYGSKGAKYTNAAGEVYSRPWNQPANWTSLGLGAHTGGKVAIGMAAFNDAGGNPVVLAAVWGSGMWRYAAGAWSNRSAAIGASGSAGNQIHVIYTGGGLAWAYDRGSGVYRSADYGLSWTLIWAKTSSNYRRGTLAYSPAGGELWASTATGLYKLPGAASGTVAGGGITPVLNTALPGINGPVAFDGAGNLICALTDTGAGSGIVSSPDHGATWADIAGDSSFAQCNCNPEFISIGPDSRIYVSGSNVVAQGFAGAAPPPPSSAPFTEVQTSGNILGTAGQLPLWFSQPGGAPSKPGTMLSARVETTDGTATITAPAGFVLALDVPAAAATGTTRVLIYHYLGNPGGIGSPAMTPMTVPPALRRAPALAAAPAILPGAVTAGRGAIQPGAAGGPQILGGPPQAPGDNFALFTSSNSAATIKGKLTEFSTPPGTVQYFDQSGSASSASGLASPASFPVTAAGANAYSGGLGVAFFGANFSVNPSGESWALPSGWASDGVVSNIALDFAMYSEAGLAAGTTSVTGQTTFSGGTMGSWAAALATYYALAATPVTITTASCPNGTVGTAYSKTLAASGGATPYTWALASGTLPAGLSLSSGGVLSGTPTTGAAYNFTVQVTDAAAQTATAAYAVTIAATVTVTTASLPAGQTGAPYTAQLAASGGKPPYSWAITAGSLPPGLALSGTGAIAGTPLLTGTYNFTVQAADQLGAAGTAALSIVVTAGPLAVTTAALAPASMGIPYTAALAAAGGTLPYTWAITAGSLPPGLAMGTGYPPVYGPAYTGAADGTITGTPTTPGTYTFTARVTDAAAATASASFTIVVYLHLIVPPAPGPWRILYGPPQPAGGVTGEVLQAQNKTITLRTEPDQNHEVSFDAGGTDPAIAGITELETDLIVMYGAQIIFDGRVVPTQDTLTASAHRTQVTALDYREVLRRRAILDGVPSGTLSPSNVDQAAIAWNLIKYTQGLPGGNLGITQGTGQATGVKRTWTGTLGDYIGDDITGLAKLSNGFEWQITPYGMSDLRFDVFYPQQGASRGAVLAWGDARISAITRNVDPSTFADCVYVTSSASTSGTKTLTPVHLEASDIATRPEGRWDTVTGTDDQTQSTLNDHAAALLSQAQVVIPSYTIVFYPGAWGGPSDIWLGDTVTVQIDSGRLQVNDQLRVVEMMFTISPDNVETLTLTVGAIPFQLHKAIPKILKAIRYLKTR